MSTRDRQLFEFMRSCEAHHDQLGEKIRHEKDPLSRAKQEGERRALHRLMTNLDRILSLPHD